MMKKEGCEIEAIGINYTMYVDKKKSVSRNILSNVNCRAKPWEILAIVGPSGAGKSSLLEILAGKVIPQTGSVLMNHTPISLNPPLFKKMCGYVTQKDSLFPLLTVQETLLFSAKLRRPNTHDLLSKVDTLIDELGLSHVANARVGDDGTRGISGGERRRVSIGVDVVHDPKVIILDEPTSGLDSTSALQITDMLKTMAETRGRTVILTIHQPGFRIVKLFNSILLLANGCVLHHGTVEQLNLHLVNGLKLSPRLHVNVIEFAIDSIQTIITIQQQQHTINSNKTGGRNTLQLLFQHDEMKKNTSTTLASSGTGSGGGKSRFGETMILSHRFCKNIYRTKELFACRCIQMVMAGVVMGSIFYDLNSKNGIDSASERVGLFAFILTFLLSCTTEALPIFLQEREILMRETSCGSYRISSYSIANGIVYLPFLLIVSVLFSVPLYWMVGLNPSFAAFLYFVMLIWLILYTANSVVVCFSALVPNFIVGNSVISGVMGSFFLFSGYFISNKEIPSYWIFMHYISLFKYPFEGFLINEFNNSNNCYEYMFGACIVNGEDVLKELGYGEESRWRNVVIMLCFILLYRFMCYVILRFRCSSSTTTIRTTTATLL